MQTGCFKGRTFGENVQSKLALRWCEQYCITSRGGYLRFIAPRGSESQIRHKFGIVDTRGMKVSSPACSDVTASTSAAVNEYLRQSPRSFHLLYQADSKSSLGCIHCYLIPPVTFPATHTHTQRHFTGNAVPNPACMAASIFHNASCTSVRYGPWFHLCEGMVALLSAPEWNSCGSMSLTRQSQTDGVFTCCTAAASGSCGYTGKLR